MQALILFVLSLAVLQNAEGFICTYNVTAQYAKNISIPIQKIVLYIDDVVDITSIGLSVTSRPIILQNRVEIDYPCGQCIGISSEAFYLTIMQKLNASRSVFCIGFDFPVEVYDVVGNQVYGVLPNMLYAGSSTYSLMACVLILLLLV